MKFEIIKQVSVPDKNDIKEKGSYTIIKDSKTNCFVTDWIYHDAEDRDRIMAATDKLNKTDTTKTLLTDAATWCESHYTEVQKVISEIGEKEEVTSSGIKPEPTIVS